MSDEVLTPGDGLRGVHTVFRYRVAGGPPQVIDQTALPQRRREQALPVLRPVLHGVLQQRQKEITNVVSSFTVREKP